ncbi:15276_t:CDS:1, partial [Gigaspora rosea]
QPGLPKKHKEILNITENINYQLNSNKDLINDFLTKGRLLEEQQKTCRKIYERSCGSLRGSLHKSSLHRRPCGSSLYRRLCESSSYEKLYRSQEITCT